MTNNEKNNDKSLKTKILNNKTKKSLISHKFIRPHSPNIERKENKILESENLEITAKKDAIKHLIFRYKLLLFYL